MKKLLLLFVSLFSLHLTAQEKFSDADIQNFLNENIENLDLTPSDITDYQIADSYESNKGLLTHITIVQTIDGIPIEDALINLTVLNRDHRVVYHGNRFIKGIKGKIASTDYTLTPQDAFASVQDELGYVSRQALVEKENKEGKISFERPVFADKDVVVEKKYFYDHKSETIYSAWEVNISMLNSQDMWVYKIDATNGKVLAKRNLTLYCSFGHPHQSGSAHQCSGDTGMAPENVEEVNTTLVSGSYNVYPLPLEAPSFGAQGMVVNPHYESASPYGWHDTNGIAGNEYTITRGNNVHAFAIEMDQGPNTNDEPDGGMDLVFDFEHDDLAEPRQQVSMALTQLFYLVSMIHDITYGLGFDEASRNFQQNNYGNGGSQGDQVNAIINYAFENNASMGTPGDGSSPTLSMGVWNQTSSTVRIFEPADLAGAIDFSGTATDGWGYTNYDDFDVTAEIAIAFDASAQNATECCDEIVNASEVAGKIALIDRGGCEFGSKALNAQNAGAVGCIVCNVPGVNGGDGEEGILMGGGADGPMVTIPSIFLPTSMCNRIRASINSGTPVEMQIKPEEILGPNQINTALDNGIALHEFMHGITNRMSNGLNSDEQMGEGWSDLLALALTHEEGDTGSDRRGIGTFVLAENNEGDGIRRFPYSTDMSINPQTYADLANTGGSVHNIGELWVGMTWDMYWNFIDEYGFDPDWSNTESGNFKAMKLVLEALKLQPGSPGFVDGRNAIIGADQIFYDGANECLIWDAFARRGLGIDADQGNSNNLNDGVVSFETTLRCNPRLDLKRSVTTLVSAGNPIQVTATVTNFTEADQTNVTVKEIVPAGLSYIDNSSNIPATLNGNELSFDLGDMSSEQAIELTYELATPSTPSVTKYYDDLQDNSQFTVDFANGFNNWSLNSTEARSGTRSVNIPDVTSQADIRMVYSDLPVSGDNPTFRFWHKYETNAGSNGGFVEISTDGTLWFPVVDKIILNGYNSVISYQNLVIPNLQGYTGTLLEDWQDVYIDLSDYAGQNVSIRFRFATADPADITGLEALRGWYVDDVEVMDMISFTSSACASSDQFNEVCSDGEITILDSEAGGVSTEDELFDSHLNMSLYPNPADDQVIVQLNSTENYSAQLSINNIDGKQVYQSVLNIDNVTSITKINTSNFAKGMYLVKLQSGNAVKTQKLVIN